MRSDLTDLLGQVVLADRLSAELSKPGARQWLRGPSGSGKTTVIGLVAERLKSTCKVIRLTGDAGHAGTKFLAFHRALAGTRMRKSVRDAIETGFVAPLKVIPIVGGAAADLAKIAAAGIGAPKPEFLTAEQQDILQDLQHVAGGEHLISSLMTSVG